MSNTVSQEVETLIQRELRWQVNYTDFERRVFSFLVVVVTFPVESNVSHIQCVM